MERVIWSVTHQSVFRILSNNLAVTGWRGWRYLTLRVHVTVWQCNNTVSPLALPFKDQERTKEGCKGSLKSKLSKVFLTLRRHTFSKERGSQISNMRQISLKFHGSVTHHYRNFRTRELEDQVCSWVVRLPHVTAVRVSVSIRLSVRNY